MTLDEPEAEVLLREVALLADPSVLDRAISRIIRSEAAFPPIATIRSYYRAENEAGRRAAIPESTGSSEIPEWIKVWYWHMRLTRSDRQKQNSTSRQAVDDRPPVRMRDFPQYVHPAPDAYTVDEYEEIRRAWVKAGSPSPGTVSEIFAAVA